VELGGRIYLIGGLSQSAPNNDFMLTDVDVYDPATESWSQAAPLPTPRRDPFVVVWCDRILVIGGFAHPSGPWLETVEAYDPDTDSWQQLNPLPEARGWGGAAVLDGTIYLLGGTNSIDTVGTTSVLCGTPQFGCASDLNADGKTDGADLGLLLLGWGICP